MKEESAIQEQALRQLPGVLEVNQRMGEIQVVIGNEVQNVYYAVNKLVGDSESTTVKEKKGNGLSRIIDTIAGIFTPILPALCGCAMLQAVLVILTTLNWVATDSTTYQIINYCSNVIFYFLPMLLAFTSAEEIQLQSVCRRDFSRLSSASGLHCDDQCGNADHVIRSAGNSGILFIVRAADYHRGLDYVVC